MSNGDREQTLRELLADAHKTIMATGGDTVSGWEDDPIPAFLMDDGTQPTPVEVGERLERFAQAASLAGVPADKAAAKGAFIDGVLPNLADDLAATAIPGRWRIDDDDSAEWAGRVRAKAAAKIEETEERAGRWRAQIDDWLESTTRRNRLSVAAMEALLEDYALRQRDESDGKRKTVKLPSVEVRTTASAARPEVVKADEFLAWAGDHCPDLVRTPDPEPAANKFGDWLEVGEVVYAYQFDVILSCGHPLSWADAPDPDGHAPDFALGELVGCVECEPDVIDGPPLVAMTSAQVTPMMRLAVLKKGTTVEAAGLAVRPETVTAKVKT